MLDDRDGDLPLSEYPLVNACGTEKPDGTLCKCLPKISRIAGKWSAWCIGCAASVSGSNPGEVGMAWNRANP